jgi:glucoamylase
VEQIADVHFMLWDVQERTTKNSRDDPVGSELYYNDSDTGKCPLIYMHQWYQFPAGYRADLWQDVFVTPNYRAVYIHNHVVFQSTNQHTVFVVINPEIDEFDSRGDGDTGYYTSYKAPSGNTYDAMVSHDGANYVVVVMKNLDNGQTTFDGYRTGIEGKSNVLTKSAWNDVYAENDGWIDTNAGPVEEDIDQGFGLWFDRDQDVYFDIVIGFGTTETEALSAATNALEIGYINEKKDFEDAWAAWFIDKTCPVTNATVKEIYFNSLGALKMAQDPEYGAMIAGPFQPRDFEYTYVWPRDLVIMIQAQLAAGMNAEANACLDWLDKAQITDGDRKGTWWQNYYVDGAKHWEQLQLDQVAGPIYAAWLIYTKTNDSKVLTDHYDICKRAADFLLSHRDAKGYLLKAYDPWEETEGLSIEGNAAVIAGLRAMAELAEANGDLTYAKTCREAATTIDCQFDANQYTTSGIYGDHEYYITAKNPTWNPEAEKRPDATSFMVYYPWNVRNANEMHILESLDDTNVYTASYTSCLGRYPKDKYIPPESIEDGGWPLCEAYADFARWQSGVDSLAIENYVFKDAPSWATSASLLPERVDANGNPRWNSPLLWSHAMYILAVKSYAENKPYGLAPSSPPKVTTTFRVHYDVGWGNNIAIRGSIPQLNNWQAPGKACKWTEGNVWVCETTDIPYGTAFEWKPLINDEHWSENGNYKGVGGQIMDEYPDFEKIPGVEVTPTPVTPSPSSSPSPTPTPPGFEAVLMIIGLLTVAYLIRRKKH